MARVTLQLPAALTIVLCTLIASACKQEARAPAFIASVSIAQSEQDEFVSSLDDALLKYSLKRFGAAPGLRELKGRDVLYINYRRELSDKWTYLAATDIVRQGVIEVHLYPEYFESAETRDSAFRSVQRLLAKYGSKLQQNPSK